MVRGAIATRKKTFAVAVNPEKIHKAQDDSKLRELLNVADMKLCDGVGASLAVRMLYSRLIPRITGISLFFELVRLSADEGWRVFILGASEESNAEASLRLREKFSDLNIVGRRNGYFEDDDAVVREINACEPDILFVAMGSPRQEYWITQNSEALDVPFCMGVGGSLDVVSGRAAWAPAFFRRTGLEWLYRLGTDPKRWRRQRILPLFAFRILCERARIHNH